MYRETPYICPACSTLMEARELALEDGSRSELELCTRCGGIFLDFLDGEPGNISRRLVEQPLETDARQAEQQDPAAATGVCPVCRLQMEPGHYLEQGPLVLRCPGCAGMFASREQVQALADYYPDPELEPQHASLLERIRGLFSD